MPVKPSQTSSAASEHSESTEPLAISGEQTATLPSPRSILVNIGALLSGTATARVLSALALALTARQIGPEQLGAFVASLALLRIASVVFSLGMDGWLLRYGGASEEPTVLPASSTAVLAVKLVLGGLWVLGVAWLLPRINGLLFAPPVVLLVALIVWLDEVANAAWSIFKTALRNDLILWLLTGTQLLVLCGVLLLMLFEVEQLLPFLAARLVATALGCCWTLFMIRRVVGLANPLPLLRPLLRQTLPFAASMLLTMIYARADVAIIGGWLGREQAGLYAPAATITTALFLLPAAIYGVVLPVLSRISSQLTTNSAARQRFPDTARQALLGSTAVGLLLTLGLALVAHPLIEFVYGDEFAVGNNLPGTVLVTLSLILLLRCVSFVLAAVIVAADRQRQRVVVQGVAALFNVGVNLLLITRFGGGIVDVAIVYVLTEALLMLGYGALAWRWWRQVTTLPGPSAA